MNQGFGIESPRPHSETPHRQATRFLVVIDAAGAKVARLYLDTYELVAEFDAGTEEVTVMTKGLSSVTGASGKLWERALQGHTARERAAAVVYTLDV
jgi:hypothetical protein